jgi:RNA polymerase sigma factor (sigma-70 family)
MTKPLMRGADHGELVRAAALGSEDAWRELVDCYLGLILAIARNHRLSTGDAADVSQTTWLRLFENIHKINDPSRIGAWLAMTARRECLRLIGRSGRQVLVPETATLPDAWAVAAPDLDAGLLAHERQEHLQQALAQLPERSRHLMRLLMLDPPPTYEEISAAMEMPIGSIGPTRGRCLRHLQRILVGQGIAGPADAVYEDVGC